jgi:hypothetical protein
MLGHKYTDMTNKFKLGCPISNAIDISPELIIKQRRKKKPTTSIYFLIIVMVKKFNFEILTYLHILGPPKVVFGRLSV